MGRVEPAILNSFYRDSETELLAIEDHWDPFLLSFRSFTVLVL